MLEGLLEWGGGVCARACACVCVYECEWVRERGREREKPKSFYHAVSLSNKTIKSKILPRPNVLQCPAVTATDTWWHINVCVCEYAGCFVQSTQTIVCFCVPAINFLLDQPHYESLTWSETHPEWASFKFRWATNFSERIPLYQEGESLKRVR